MVTVIDQLPDPLVPPEVDLTGFRFMPLDTVRLLDSDLFAISTGEEFKAAVAMWCKAWLQKPAGSLPNDDRVLAHLSSAGPRWKALRAVAMRGFIQCSDGRWYHPVIAEKALEAWARREDWQEANENKKSRQQRWRERLKAISARLRELNVSVPAGASMETMERLLRDAEASTPPSTDASTPPSTPASHVDAPETGMTGTGTGTGTGILKPYAHNAGARRGEVAGRLTREGVAVSPAFLTGWVDELDAADDALTEALARCRNSITLSQGEKIPAKYFDKALRRYLEEASKPKVTALPKRAQPEQDFSKLDYSKGF